MKENQKMPKMGPMRDLAVRSNLRSMERAMPPAMGEVERTDVGKTAIKEWQAGPYIGRKIWKFTPYAGFMLESSTMEVTYDYIVQSPSGPLTQSVKFEIDGENSSRLTLGVSIRLLFININADYNIGSYNNFSAGLNFAI